MGAKSEVKLGKVICDKAQPAEKQYEIWDSELAGFGLRVMPTGIKSYIVRYRIDGGGRTATRRSVTIARYGTMTFEQDALDHDAGVHGEIGRSEEHASELQSLMRISYAVFCLKQKRYTQNNR